MAHAMITANSPKDRFMVATSSARAALEWSDPPEPVGICTTATPTINRTSDNHFFAVNVRFSMVTLKMAVVRIFNW